MTNNLKDLVLEELSLVDRPANKAARVTIFKRDSDEQEVAESFDQHVDEIVKRDTAHGSAL